MPDIRGHLTVAVFFNFSKAFNQLKSAKMALKTKKVPKWH